MRRRRVLTFRLFRGYDAMMTTFTHTLATARARLTVLALLFLAVLPATAQLVVYEMDFKRTEGFNDRPFLGGYFVAPVVGGTGSFVFTQKGAAGVAVVPVNDGGRLFRAITDKGEVKWVAQAQVGGSTSTTPPTDDGTDDAGDGTDTGTGTDTTSNTVNVATGSFLAVGRADGNETFTTPLVKFETKIARTLEGRTITASSADIDDSGKRIGFVSRGDWKLKFDQKQTNIVNRDDLDLTAATTYLEGLLTGDSGGPEPVDPTLRIVTTSPLTPGTVGTAYSLQLSASGGTGTRSWSLAALSTLPPGLTLSATGLISGTPTTAATTTFSVVVQDSATPPRTVSRAFSLTINPVFEIITASPLPPATRDVPYVATLTMAGNKGTVTWSLNPGSPPLPTGLVLDGSTGQIIGTPTVSGTSNFTIRASDSGPPATFTTKNYQLVVNTP